MFTSLYQEMKNRDSMRVYTREIQTDENGNSSNHPCYRCVVASNRTPEHCDRCKVNPDRDRFKKAGLL